MPRRMASGVEGRGSDLPPPGESTILSAYVSWRMYLIMAVTGIGYLALTWSTVVLLGGFVTALQNKDFWCLTVISMLQAASIFNDLRDQLFLKLLKLLFGTYLKEVGEYTCDFLGWWIRQKIDNSWLDFVSYGSRLLAFFIVVIPLSFLWFFLAGVLYLVMSVYGFLGQIACFALALWRILQPDYGDMDGDASKGNLKPALMMFYWLVLCQFVMYLALIIANWFVVYILVPVISRDSKLIEEWGTKAVKKYLSDTGAKCWREGDPVSISARSLSQYAADMLDSESWLDNLFGARMLATFIKHGANVRSLLLHSRPKIQMLIDTLGWRGRGDMGMRECAAGIVAHLADDIHLPQFPGALRCISSVLQLQDEAIVTTYWDKYTDRQQVGDDRGKKANIWQKAYIWMYSIQRFVVEGFATTSTYWVWDSYDQQVGEDSRSNNLILLGLVILEKLAASDHNNCSDICSTPDLLPKITAPLYSGTFSGDIKMSDWAKVVNAAFKVIYQLISHAPKDISTRLRLDISSNEQAMRNLKSILDQGQGTGIIGLETQEKELLMRAMEILTDLALDSSVSLTSETKENLIKKQLRIFFLADQDTDSRTSPLIATAGRMLVLLTSNSKINSDFILKACDDDSPAKKDNVSHLTELLVATNNITYRTIAAEILENFCTHCDWINSNKSLLEKVVTKLQSIKSDQPEGKISSEKENKAQSRTSTLSQNQKNFVPLGKDEEKGKSMIQEISSYGDQKKSSDEQNKEQTAKKELQALLSLALVICDKLISANDVIQEEALGGDAFVVKLKSIIDDNCQPKADSLRIVKLCGRIAASMMQCQPYVELFRNKEFLQSLSKASKIMSSLEICMMFAETDLRLKKTVRPLLSEVVAVLEQKIPQSV